MRHIQTLLEDPGFTSFHSVVRSAIVELFYYETAYMKGTESYFLLRSEDTEDILINKKSLAIKSILLVISNPFIQVAQTRVQLVLRTILEKAGERLIEKDVFRSIEDFGNFMYTPFYIRKKHLLMNRIFQEIANVLREESTFKIFTLYAVKTA